MKVLARFDSEHANILAEPIRLTVKAHQEEPSQLLRIKGKNYYLYQWNVTDNIVKLPIGFVACTVCDIKDGISIKAVFKSDGGDK